MRVDIGSVDLSPRKASWLKVVCKMNSESRRVRVGKALEGHFPRFQHIYIREVEYLAAIHGLSWEEMYVLLDSDREMPFSSEDLAWARVQPPVVIQAEEATGRGRLGVELSSEEFAQEFKSTLSLEAIIALETGFRQGLSSTAAAPEPQDLSPWAVGFRLARTFNKEE